MERDAQDDASDFLRNLNVKAQTVAKRIHDELRTSIIRGDLPAGMCMTETRLSERLNVSRTPLREAVQMLEAEGWVQRLRNGGIEVTTQTLEDTYHQYQLRAALEGLIARELAPTLDDHDLQRICSWTEMLTKAADEGDPDGVADFGRRVHELLRARTRNTAASQMLNLLRERIERARNQVIVLPGRPSEAAREHEDLCNALVTRDHLRAETAMIHHVLSGGAWLLQHLGGEDEATALRQRLDELHMQSELIAEAQRSHDVE